MNSTNYTFSPVNPDNKRIKIYTHESNIICMVRNYQKQYVAKSWSELTKEQQQEAITKFEDNFINMYSDDEYDLFKSDIENIIYDSDIIESINVDWNDSSQGPYLTSDWKVELSDYPRGTIDLTEEGIGVVTATIYDVYADAHGVIPESGYFGIEFDDYDDDEYDDDDIEEIASKSGKLYSFLVPFVNKINHALNEYWSAIHNYSSGYETLSEFAERELTESGYEFELLINDDGSEQLVGYNY